MEGERVLQGKREMPHSEMNTIKAEMGGKGFRAKNPVGLCAWWIEGSKDKLVQDRKATQQEVFSFIQITLKRAINIY